MDEALEKHKEQIRVYQRNRYARMKETLRLQRLSRLHALSPEEREARLVKSRESSRVWRQAHPEYGRRYVAENPEAHKARLKAYRETPEGREVMRNAVRASRERRKQAIRELKSVPCKDCGGKFHPEVMDFDHRDPSQKTFNISTFSRRLAWSAILEEVAKCDVVCANCHRLRTVIRRNLKKEFDSAA